MCPECRWIHSDGSASFGYGLGVAWFLRVRLVRLSAPCVSLGSFALVWFVWVRLGCRSDSFGSSRCAMGVAGFGRVRLVCSRAPWRSLGRSDSSSSFGYTLTVDGFFRVHFVRAGGPWISVGSVWFVRVRSCGHWNIPGSYGSLGCAMAVSLVVRVRLFRLGAP